MYWIDIFAQFYELPKSSVNAILTWKMYWWVCKEISMRPFFPFVSVPLPYPHRPPLLLPSVPYHTPFPCRCPFTAPHPLPLTPLQHMAPVRTLSPLFFSVLSPTQLPYPPSCEPNSVIITLLYGTQDMAKQFLIWDHKNFNSHLSAAVKLFLKVRIYAFLKANQYWTSKSRCSAR